MSTDCRWCSSIGAVVLGLALSGASPARADAICFAGRFAPVNWMESFPYGGYVDASGAPESITLVGPNDGVRNVNADYTIVLPESGSGIWSFRWDYLSEDYGSFDIAYYLLNGVRTLLHDNGIAGTHYTGEVSLAVHSGDTIGFRVWTYDGLMGAGALTVSDFDAPVPETATTVLFGAGVAMLAALSPRLRRETATHTRPATWAFPAAVSRPGHHSRV